MQMKKYIAPVLLLCIAMACQREGSLDVEVNESEDLITSELDQYIQENFTEKYGMTIRYKYIDDFVSAGERATPPRVDVVRPMLDFIEEYWINPYLEIPNGEAFFRAHVPADIVLLGSSILNSDGTETLGTADAGAQITFTKVNDFDLEDEDWKLLQLQVVYHEFAHTVHQLYKLPDAFETISPAGYTGPGSWYVLTDEEALARGFVSPYGTSSPNEDFAEVVAFYLFDSEFESNFISLVDDCDTDDCLQQNDGKESINEKINSIKKHYESVTGIDLDELRAAIQGRL